jgi:hypothetical protein
MEGSTQMRAEAVGIGFNVNPPNSRLTLSVVVQNNQTQHSTHAVDCLLAGFFTGFDIETESKTPR